jgi:glycosyltransferase involved in cell wall biosynthesis
MERAPYSLAFVQDWLVDFGGAERCIEALCPEYPQAPIHTLFHDPTQFAGSFLEDRSVHSTFLNNPFFRKRYRAFLPLYPLAVEQLDVGTPDVVLSFSHSVAKGVLTRGDTLHVCYCHTPVRYAWDLYHEYLRLSGLTHGMKSWAARAILHYIRLWDASCAQRVDAYIANSRHVAQRIRKTYGREAEVIHPPVDVGRFAPLLRRGDHYLVAGRLVAYKRFDLAVATCTRLGLPLRVVGEGPELDNLRRIAGPTVAFLGRVSDGCVAREMAEAKAFLFCGEEDFGITPVEAQAAGTPVIAYGRGGALETVVPPSGDDWSEATGLFFREPSPESLADALRVFDASAHRFRPEAAVANSGRFSTDRYIREMRTTVDAKWGDFRARR